MVSADRIGVQLQCEPSHDFRIEQLEMQAESERDPISALKVGHLMIHCFRMELVQNSSDR
jgi:hypothetical protein